MTPERLAQKSLAIYPLAGRRVACFLADFNARPIDGAHSRSHLLYVYLPVVDALATNPNATTTQFIYEGVSQHRFPFCQFSYLNPILLTHQARSQRIRDGLSFPVQVSLSIFFGRWTMLSVQLPSFHWEALGQLDVSFSVFGGYSSAVILFSACSLRGRGLVTNSLPTFFPSPTSNLAETFITDPRAFDFFYYSDDL